jgi:hypothetical protein
MWFNQTAVCADILQPAPAWNPQVGAVRLGSAEVAQPYCTYHLR